MFLLVLIAVPLVEVAAFVAVGAAAGWVLAVALLLGTSLLGVFMLRAVSRGALVRITRAASARRSPGPAAVDAALGLLGAVLLVVPGFVTDALGLPLLFPPTRRFVRRALSRQIARRVMGVAVVAERFAPAASAMAPADVESTAVDDERGQLGR
jgi:UPF0716 protein FxsA